MSEKRQDLRAWFTDDAPLPASVLATSEPTSKTICVHQAEKELLAKVLSEAVDALLECCPELAGTSMTLADSIRFAMKHDPEAERDVTCTASQR